MEQTPKKLAHGLVLGEGPLWCEHAQTLLFVDIERSEIHRLSPDGIDVIKTPGRVSCIVPTGDETILAAVETALFDVDLKTAQCTPRTLFPQPDFLRWNDGKCDAMGRLWVGNMAADQSHPRAKGGGSLYCIEKDEIVAWYDGFTIPNGMAWSTDGGTFYHIDTATRQIDAYDVECGTQLKNRRTVVSFAPEEGSPDGMCMDAAGHLWVALWGGYAVACVDPVTGARLQTMRLPDKNVSCCTFGGKDMRTLFITTAQDENGLGGCLYSVETQTEGTLPHHYNKQSAKQRK